MRRIVLPVAAAVASVLALPGLAGAAPGVSVAPAGGVALPTGDRVAVSTVAGRTSVRVLPAEQGVTASFQQLRLAGDTYVLPAEARPFLGRLLDASLFDVTSLASREVGGRIPVTLTTADSAAVRVPGLTVTGRTGKNARGWLDQSGAAAIRAELVRDWRDAVGPEHRYPAALFGNVTSLHLAGATPPVSPAYPMRTLILKVLDVHGRPVPFGFGFIGNVDDFRRSEQFFTVVNGEARVSVPLGHYTALTDVPDFDPVTGDFIDRIIPISDYTVSSNLQTLTFRGSSATVQPTVATPQPGTLQQESVEYDRSDRRGITFSASFGFGGSGFEVLVAPTPHVRVGSLHWLASWTLTGTPPYRDLPYSYDLSFEASGRVPAAQHHDVQARSLAAITSRYYNDQPRDSQFLRLPVYPFQTFIFGSFYPLQTPVVRTEYVNSSPGVAWSSALLADPTDQDPFGGEIDDDLRTYAAGTTTQASWQRGLLAPAPPRPSAADHAFFCPACRTATRMTVVLAPFTDATPGHFGWVYPVNRHPVTHFALYRDGKKVAGGANHIGVRVAAPSGEATYRVHMDVDRRDDYVLTAPAMTTDLTFRSSAKDGSPLPPSWICDAPQAQDCTVLPILTARMPLPTDLTDRMRIGTSTALLSIAPLAGGRDAITSAAVYADSGTGFHAVPMQRLANGRYRVTFTNPTAIAGAPVSVRVVAKDDRGGSLTQTTDAAYLVASS